MTEAEIGEKTVTLLGDLATAVENHSLPPLFLGLKEQHMPSSPYALARRDGNVIAVMFKNPYDQVMTTTYDLPVSVGEAFLVASVGSIYRAEVGTASLGWVKEAMDNEGESNLAIDVPKPDGEGRVKEFSISAVVAGEPRRCSARISRLDSEFGDEALRAIEKLSQSLQPPAPQSPGR